MIGMTKLAAPFLISILLLFGWRDVFSRARPIAYAVYGVIFVQMGFMLSKSVIPFLVPYYADPALATFDAWLHGGVDPWVLAHRWVEGTNIVPWLGLYLRWWSIPAMILPVLIAVSDPDLARVRRYSWLFLLSWLVIGNVLAVVGSSAGPVFYDMLLGQDRFAGLNSALAESGISDSRIGTIQAALWQQYQAGSTALGLTISAFPSMHVAVAAITALYLAERSLWLAPLGLAFLLAILFLSVLTGYHYAIDGYASILLVAAGSWALRSRATVENSRSGLVRVHPTALILRGASVWSRLLGPVR